MKSLNAFIEKLRGILLYLAIEIGVLPRAIALNDGIPMIAKVGKLCGKGKRLGVFPGLNEVNKDVDLSFHEPILLSSKAKKSEMRKFYRGNHAQKLSKTRKTSWRIR